MTKDLSSISPIVEYRRISVSANTPATIRVEDLEKSYGDSKALDRVSLTVSDGEFSVLLGPSGCGKTTLLRCIAGLERPDSGHIYIGEEMVDTLPPGQRGIAMVFQTVSLFPHMTVAENIAFPLKVRGSSVQARGDKVREVAKLLSIEGLLDKAPRELSGGEQQRVEIGRAITREPKAFLMDEPLSSLDSPLRAQLRAELKRIQREVGATTLYVTHDQAEALALADMIGVMNKGALLQYGRAQSVLERPSSAFVAGFVGDPQANIINVRVAQTDDGAALPQQSPAYALVGEGFMQSIPTTTARDILERVRTLRPGATQAEGAIQVSIRPEDIQVVNSPGGSEDKIKGTVVLDETLTLYRLLTVELDGDGAPASGDSRGRTSLKVLSGKGSKFGLGDEVWLRPDLGKARYFERTTGAAIL
jgi:ABC-type sugar transport system ATPase subunit